MPILDKLISFYNRNSANKNLTVNPEDVKSILDSCTEIQSSLLVMELKATDELNATPINIPAGFSGRIRSDSFYFSHFSVNTPGMTSSLIIYNSYYADSANIVGTYATTSIYEKTFKCYFDSLYVVNQGTTSADITLFIK